MEMKMSKINIEFDTADKSVSIMVDGEKMDNIDGVYIYKRYDSENKYYIELSSYEHNKENEISKTTRICAQDGSLVNKDSGADKDIEQISKLLLG
jgi:Ni,Fe-hydrogenase III component G